MCSSIFFINFTLWQNMTGILLEFSRSPLYSHCYTMKLNTFEKARHSLTVEKKNLVPGVNQLLFDHELE